MSLSKPQRNTMLPLKVQQLLDKMYARGTGFSGPQILDFFSQYSDKIESYPWSGGAPSRWQIFEDCLSLFNLDQQKKIIGDLLVYDGPMSHGKPAQNDIEEIQHWLGQGPTPLSINLKSVETLNWNAVRQTWEKATNRIMSDPPGAITSVCKHVLDERKIAYSHDGDLQKLYRKTAETLQLSPDQQGHNIFKQVLGGCASIANGIAGLRNTFGDSHGQGLNQKEAERRHARLAVNAAGTIALFLIESHLAEAD